LVPLLLLLFPKEPPEIIASISLAVVFFNASAGSFSYARLKRIDYRSGLIFSLAAVPGAILGALTTAYMARRLFDSVFGVFLVTASLYLLIFPNGRRSHEEAPADRTPSADSLFHTTRTFTDNEGRTYTFSYNPLLGVGLSLIVGYVSSLLGVGGGFIHVPILASLLNFPVHVATATSHFILAIMAFSGTAVHILTGTFAHGVRRTVMLSIAVMLGAPFGAALSDRIHGDWIIRGLAVALGFVGIRILLAAV